MPPAGPQNTPRQLACVLITHPEKYVQHGPTGMHGLGVQVLLEMEV